MSWWLWQQSLGASERPRALAAAGAGLLGGLGWGLRSVLGESPAGAYFCAGLYALSIVPFTLAEPRAVLRDA